MPTISDASTPSRSVMINACSITSFSSRTALLEAGIRQPRAHFHEVGATLVPISSVLRTKLVVNQSASIIKHDFLAPATNAPGYPCGMSPRVRFRLFWTLLLLLPIGLIGGC